MPVQVDDVVIEKPPDNPWQDPKLPGIEDIQDPWAPAKPKPAFPGPAQADEDDTVRI